MKSINLINGLLAYFDDLSIQKMTREHQNATYEGARFKINGHH